MKKRKKKIYPIAKSDMSMRKRPKKPRAISVRASRIDMTAERYIPKVGENFIAVLRRYNTQSRAGICRCSRRWLVRKKYVQMVEGIDADGDLWQFRTEDFIFEQKNQPPPT